MRVAIIGAGLAGLTCAVGLAAHGHPVTVVDKGRRPGGRMSTRRLDTPLGPAFFDHGAQYFTARDPAFRAEVERWRASGLAAPWPAAGKDAWVGTPGMNAPTLALAERVDVRTGTKIETVRHDAGGWLLDAVPDRFDALVVAVPAEQVGALIDTSDPVLAAIADATPSQPCWTVMAAFAEPLPVAADVLRDAGAIGWAARNSAKPGRTGPESWVVQASPDWSRQRLEDEAPRVEAALLDALGGAIGERLPPLLAAAAHRWRYARSGHADREVAWNPRLRLGLCGDWLLGPRIESAWLSGRALARRMTPATD